MLNKFLDRRGTCGQRYHLDLQKKARLRESLLTSQGLSSDSTCVLEAEPGKLYIKRREPGPGITMPP